MTALDAALVRRKLALISRNLDDLATIDGFVADVEAWLAQRGL